MSSYRISYKDLILKVKLGTTNRLRYLCGTTEKGDFKIPVEYNIVFADNFKNSYSNKWVSSNIWWEQPYHPDYLNQWYDAYQINRTSQGIEFNASKKMQYFPKIGRGIPNAVCQLRTKESWLYGIFVCSAKLPKGTYLWPGLWLCGVDAWPPEIDALEGHSKNTNDYEGYTNLQSNVHFLHDNKHSMIGGINHYLPNDVTTEFIEYTIWWEENFIKIYYNGYLVRHITDRIVLDKINLAQAYIIGSGVDEGFNTTNQTPLVINRVEIYQK